MGAQSDNYKYYLNILFKDIKNIIFIIHFLFNSEIQAISI